MSDTTMQNGWHTRRFDEIAAIVNDRIDDPAEADVDRYVGLEHLDSDSLTIRRWGSPDDVEATKLRFRAGDIIFGRRRAYQRKLAVADFDGICSAHAMVLRARPEAVRPEFLPFFMQSDLFMKRAQEISVGSLSPTINWRTLAKEEFDLPPLDEQRRIAAVLVRSSRLAQSAATLEARHDALLRTMVDTHVQRVIGHSTFCTGAEADGGRVVSLDEAGKVTDCKHRTPTIVKDGIPMVAPGDIEWGPLQLKGCKHIAAAEYLDFMDHVVVKEGDLVLSRNQTYGVASYVASEQPFALGQDTVLVQGASYPSPFIYLMLRSTFVQRQIQRNSMGSTFKRVNLADLRRLRIPAATRSHVEEITELWIAFERHAILIRSHAQQCLKLHGALVDTAIAGSSSK